MMLPILGSYVYIIHVESSSGGSGFTKGNHCFLKSYHETNSSTIANLQLTQLLYDVPPNI